MATLKCYTDQANAFRREIDAIVQLCDCVDNKDRCDDCPLYSNCLKEVSIEWIWNSISVERMADFIEYADDVCSEAEDADEEEIAWVDYSLRKRMQEDGF